MNTPNTKAIRLLKLLRSLPNGHTTGATVTELLANVQQITPHQASALLRSMASEGLVRKAPSEAKAARWVAVPLGAAQPAPGSHKLPLGSHAWRDEAQTIVPPTARHTIVPSNGPTNRESPVLNAAQRPPVMRPGAEDFRRVPSVEFSRRKEAA